VPLYTVVQRRLEYWEYRVVVEADNEEEAETVVKNGGGDDDTDPDHIEVVDSKIVSVG
jgi:hypothetical protein